MIWALVGVGGGVWARWRGLFSCWWQAKSSIQDSDHLLLLTIIIIILTAAPPAPHTCAPAASSALVAGDDRRTSFKQLKNRFCAQQAASISPTGRGEFLSWAIMFRASRRCTEVNSRASTDSGTLRKVSYLNTLHSWRVYVTALKLLVKLMGRVQSFSCCSGISWAVVLKNSSRLQEAGLLPGRVHGRAGWCREVHVHICRGRHVSTKNMKLEEFLILL